MQVRRLRLSEVKSYKITLLINGRRGNRDSATLLVGFCSYFKMKQKTPHFFYFLNFLQHPFFIFTVTLGQHVLVKRAGSGVTACCWCDFGINDLIAPCLGVLICEKRYVKGLA